MFIEIKISLRNHKFVVFLCTKFRFLDIVDKIFNVYLSLCYNRQST